MSPTWAAIPWSDAKALKHTGEYQTEGNVPHLWQHGAAHGRFGGGELTTQLG